MIATLRLIDGGQVADHIDTMSFEVVPHTGDVLEFEDDDRLYIVQSVRHRMGSLNDPVPVQKITVTLYRM